MWGVGFYIQTVDVQCCVSTVCPGHCPGLSVQVIPSSEQPVEGHTKSIPQMRKLKFRGALRSALFTQQSHGEHHVPGTVLTTGNMVVEASPGSPSSPGGQFRQRKYIAYWDGRIQGAETAWARVPRPVWCNQINVMGVRGVSQVVQHLPIKDAVLNSISTIAN
jgi:hypothetical protein